MLRICALLSLLAASSAFTVSPMRVPLTRGVSLKMMATAEACTAEEAAEAVKKAAAKFGKTQAAAAATWVDAAISEDDCPTTSLLEEQLTLFEACQVDDPDGKCKSLDAALSAFDAALVASPKVKAGPKKGPRFSLSFGGNAKEKAAAKVRVAASKFGPIQKQVAADWTKKALTLGETEDGPSLMEQQIMLFGECAVTEDGKPDPKCVALFDALDQLQVALEGKVVSPAGPADIVAEPYDSKAASGFAGGQRGQAFNFGAKRRNNGCWPNN